MTVLTADEIDIFCAKLADGCKIGPACEAINICYMTAYNMRRRDPAFASAWEHAAKAGVMKLEDEVHRRAFEGDNEAVYNKDGELTGTKTKYSDVLAIFLLKAHNPEKYRENSKLELTGPNNGPVEFTDTQLAVRLAAIMASADKAPASAEPIGEDGEPLL